MTRQKMDDISDAGKNNLAFESLRYRKWEYQYLMQGFGRGLSIKIYVCAIAISTMD